MTLERVDEDLAALERRLRIRSWLGIAAVIVVAWAVVGTPAEIAMRDDGETASLRPGSLELRGVPGEIRFAAGDLFRIGGPVLEAGLHDGARWSAFGVWAEGRSGLHAAVEGDRLDVQCGGGTLQYRRDHDRSTWYVREPRRETAPLFGGVP